MKKYLCFVLLVGCLFVASYLKIQNLSELSQSFSFTEYVFFDFYRRSLELSELGRMRKLLPLREMAESFGLVSKRSIVAEAYRQQSNHFGSGNPRESIPDRKVSVSKPYVRPINDWQRERNLNVRQR